MIEMPRQSRTQVEAITLGEAAVRFLETKGPSTARAYNLCLRRFVSFSGKDLGEFINEIERQTKANLDKPLSEKVRPGEDTVRRFIKWHEENGYANKSTRQSLAALQNALKYYGIDLSYSFIELPPDRAMRENEKHQWTLDQIKEFVRAAEYIRDKCYILFQFQSGLSISDILALDYGDIRREFEEGTTPLMIHTYRKKTGVEIKTFVGRDTVKYLRLYLESRGNLDNDDPIFTFLGSTERATPGSIQKRLRKYAEALDFIYEGDMENGSYSPARPHSLRSAFRSRLTGKVDGTLIEYWMAHDIGDQIKTYMNLPDAELRQLYAQHEHLLAVERTSREEAEEQKQGAVPESAMNVIREQGQRIAEMEVKLAEVDSIRAELSDLKKLVLEKWRGERDQH